ncbi:MAG TPA: efflux RND transporter periplasmic adaptor subunit [Polyangia bacterium]|nr:efflux RND transporter periplasmic adaptor subunit [Polyangia bacterium]
MVSRTFVSKLFALGALSAAALAGCGESTVKAGPPPPPTVLVAEVAKQDVSLFVEAVGTLDGYVDADIRARVRGILQAQRYKDGAAVKQGQLLFTIDRAEYEAAADAAKASLARAETAAAHNKAQLARRQDLNASRVVSKQELEDAEAAARDAENQVVAAKAALRQAALNLSYTEIRSPVTGIAGLAQVRGGNLVGQDGPTLLTTVSQVDPVRVSFPLSEVDYVRSASILKGLDGRDLAWARAAFKHAEQNPKADDGTTVQLVLADGSAYPHRGVIVAANRQVDATTGTIQLQALFPNPDGLLRPGQYGRVRMRRRDIGPGTLVVPDKALVQVQGSYSLAVVGADSRVKLRRVEVGQVAGPLRIIKNGVSAGERIVVEGLQKASDGALVVAQAAPPPEVPGPTTAAALPAGPR